MPKISVILTSYNHAKYLRESIESVLNQTFSDFELIIGDDASTDESWEIIQSYTDPRIRAIRYETTTIGGIINDMLLPNNISSEYVAIHHSDDAWEPRKLEKQIAILDNQPEIGAVFTNAMPVGEQGEPFEDKDHFYYSIFDQPNRNRYEWLNYFFYHGNALCHPSLLIRKACYEKCGPYRYGLTQISDFDMWVRLCLQYEIHVIPEKLVRFRVRENMANMSSGQEENHVRGLFEYVQLFDNYRQLSSYEEIKRIFPSVEKYYRMEGFDAKFVLGMIALETLADEPFKPTELFALQLLFDALKDTSRAAEIKKNYDFDVKDFRKLLGVHDVFSYRIKEKLAERDGQLAERDGQLAERDGQLAERDNQLAERNVQLIRQEQVASVLRAQLLEKDQSLQTVVAQLMESRNWADSLKEQVDIISKLSNEREKILQSLNVKLWEIYQSRAWRIIQVLWKIRIALLPPNSIRARSAAKLMRLVRWFVTLIKPAKPQVHVQKEADLISSSNLFDKEWYMAMYSNVAQVLVNPVDHYLRQGGFEGNDPGPNFSSKWYLDTYPDVFAARINPLVHYLKHGQWEGRYPNANARLSSQPEFLRVRAFQVVPYYLDPNAPVENAFGQNAPKIAVHLHMHYRDMLDQCAMYLNNIPFNFDLYVSVTEANHPDEVSEFLKKQIRLLNKVVVEKVPNRGRDLAPLIVNFGKKLLNYDFVAHIHTKRSPHNPELDNWFVDIMDSLFGSENSIHQIFSLLATDAKFVYPASNRKIVINENGWGDNYELAKSLLPQWLGENIAEYPLVEFPQGSMFWAKSSALINFLKISMTYPDFPAEPLSSDGTIVHVLERILLISANHLPGRNYRISLPRSTVKEPYFELQKDYRQSLKHKSVKVLSYYLPQFYPTPENDEWHGKGFTEWTKVRSTNPLFYGHDHQRVPHKDIGYYSLTSPEMFKKQAELMKQSGVYGQIFYHYWFTGRLILEKPVQMLLADKSIEMPFCFCWANENWTKKWDGNEDEILLGQTYSEQDAIEFINYLIPFFKDERYIRINGRPVLYIYRPISIPDFDIYKKAWHKICADHGINPPYIVAVLTRGAKSPDDFGMDAGCERVLHDWTSGNVKESKGQLHAYWPINGTVLNYDEVADYYINQPRVNDFTYFRSIIPSWDNTPRYGSEAYIINKSTPEKFQEWLASLVEDAEERLSEEERFVVVNAWNEWAETAFLEPDSQFGYAYLNSIGRALSGIGFNDREYENQLIPKTTRVSISIDSKLLSILNADEKLRTRMLSSIARSTIFSVCNIAFAQPQVAEWISDFSEDFQFEKNSLPDYTLHIKNVCYFAPDTIEQMLRMALCYDVGIVMPSHLNDPKFNHQSLSGRWETGRMDPYVLFIRSGDKRSIKCCVDARIFISESQPIQKNLLSKVSTIVRFSKSGNIRLLQNALFSLIAQTGCSVQPILALQDLPDTMLMDIKAMIKEMPWADDCYPVIREYHSTETNRDIRSVMLNDSFKSVTTKYATFLDYDDIVFHDAYSWLAERLQKNNKNASFGLIYSAVFNMVENKIKGRQVVYDYGIDYEHFLTANHSPIHGIMFNMSRINLDEIGYFDDMKYMEDYYLTLQIFTETDTDWASLQERKFVGDYFHYEGKNQTLAVLNQAERTRLISMPDYIKCEERIVALRQTLRDRK